MAKKHYTEWGKVFARLRIMYSETLKQQSQRLGFNNMYISFIQNGRKIVTPQVYESVIEHYPLSEEEKAILMRGMISDDDVKRFRSVFGADVDNGKISVPDMVYILTGYKEGSK